MGKDLVLVNPRISKAPIGMIPDFLYHKQTHEEEIARIQTLYHGVVQSTENGDYAIPPIKLDHAVPRLAKFLRYPDSFGH